MVRRKGMQREMEERHMKGWKEGRNIIAKRVRGGRKEMERVLRGREIRKGNFR